MAAMLGRLYEGQVCSAAHALELVGERWSLLIIRDAMFAGITRFTDFQRSLGVAPTSWPNAWGVRPGRNLRATTGDAGATPTTC